MDSNLESSEEEESARQFFSLSDNTIYSIGIPQIRHKHCCGCFMNAGGLTRLPVRKKNNRRRMVDNSRQTYCHSACLHVRKKNNGRKALLPFDVLRVHVTKAYMKFENALVKKAAMSDNKAFLVVSSGSGKAFLLRRGRNAVCTELLQLPSNEVNTIMRNRFLDDVIYHMGHFYAVNSIGGVGVLQTNDSKLQRRKTKITGTAQTWSGRIYLVERIDEEINGSSGSRQHVLRFMRLRKTKKGSRKLSWWCRAYMME